MKRKLCPLLFLIAFIFSITLIFANADVAYIIHNKYNIKSEFVDVLNELGLSHKIVYSSNLSITNFSDYGMILLNDEDFPNPELIPVNDLPAIIVNGRNIVDWGWTKAISKTSQNSILHADLINAEHKIAQGIVDQDIILYIREDPDVYSIEETNAFTGLEIIVAKKDHPNDGILVIAESGSILTKPGYPDTHVNARSVFFGITYSGYWSNESIQLFKNSIQWILEGPEFNITLSEGYNLVSFPLEMDAQQINAIMNDSRVSQVLEYNPGTGLVDALTLEFGKGYFINATEAFSLDFSGQEPTGIQTVDLTEGMNLVGLKSLNSMDVIDLPAEVIEISSRRVDGGYETATSYSSSWYNPDSISLIPGEGYWLKVNSDTVWQYQA